VAGGPAELAGVRAGDVISAINTKPTRGLSLYEASDLLLGPVSASSLFSFFFDRKVSRAWASSMMLLSNRRTRARQKETDTLHQPENICIPDWKG
jgi:hypothetical protein